MKNKGLSFLAATVLAGHNLAFGGIIGILKGENPQPSYQRVAFVGPAVVKEVSGLAERLSGVDQWTPITQGTSFEPGDVVRTTTGTVVLRMTESGSFVKVTPYTILRFAPFEQGWDRGVLSGREEREGYVVRSCRGEAFFRDSSGGWQLVTVNSVLPEGVQIRVGKAATVDLFGTRELRPVRLHDGTETTLSANAFAVNRVGGTAVATVNR